MTANQPRRLGRLRPGLLAPRFGMPALVSASGSTSRGGPVGGRFAIEWVAPASSDRLHGELIAADGGQRFPLSMQETARTPAADGLTVVHLLASAQGAPVGGYDLALWSTDAPPELAPRAVWLRAGDLDTLAPLQIAHFTDLHVGSRGRAGERLARVVADINALSPDLVLITGDVANNGDRARHYPHARSLLSTITAPTLIVAGNHDHGFSPRALAGLGFGPGWHHFADAFHPFLHFGTQLGGWDFIGFDSGPSRLSPLVTTRGLDSEALAALARDLDRAHAQGRRGVVLFSHTPLRSRLTGSRPSALRGAVAGMSRGTRALEDILRSAARRGQRVLHLAGHTHWMEVFELASDGKRFMRWDHRRIGPEPQSITTPVALINTQSASHSGLPFKRTGVGYGFVRIILQQDDPQIHFHRYEVDRRRK